MTSVPGAVTPLIVGKMIERVPMVYSTINLVLAGISIGMFVALCYTDVIRKRFETRNVVNNVVNDDVQNHNHHQSHDVKQP